ncbi:hypothetical protein [Arthrobacter sp. B1I2]|uniref:hypothetical protein n=1 Tax=Arthrobacter sp. B1I2 TaxID=3042263 RepID=UPI0027D8534C|nr:hypothetical protein [Arthrobacter sp. B1I2]
MTIAFGRDQYLEEQARRFEEAFEVAAGVQAHVTVESAEGDGSLRWVYEVTNGTGSDLHDVQLFYPQPLPDEDEWFDVARVGSIEAKTTKSFHQPLESNHLTPARASSLIATQYSLEFTIQGTRWQLSRQGLHKALSSAQQAALRRARPIPA